MNNKCNSKNKQYKNSSTFKTKEPFPEQNLYISADFLEG